MELLGEASMVTMKVGESLVSIKAGKEFRTQIGAPVYAGIDAAICHLFDRQTGHRLKL
jgi:multiple sugar transport system ATP-binding protein